MLTERQRQIMQGHFDPETIRRAQIHAGTVAPQTEEERIDLEHARLRRMQEAWAQRGHLCAGSAPASANPAQPDDVRQAIVELREAADALMQAADLLEGMQNG